MLLFVTKISAAILLGTLLACTRSPEEGLVTDSITPSPSASPSASASAPSVDSGDAGDAGGSAGHAGHGDAGGHHPTAEVLSGAPQLRVIATDYEFEAAGRGTQRIVVSQPVNIVLINRGSVEHEFDVADLGFHLHAEAGKRVGGGLSAVEPGVYRVVCTVAGHEDLGMVATLVVKG